MAAYIERTWKNISDSPINLTEVGTFAAGEVFTTYFLISGPSIVFQSEQLVDIPLIVSDRTDNK